MYVQVGKVCLSYTYEPGSTILMCTYVPLPFPKEESLAVKILLSKVNYTDNYANSSSVEHRNLTSQLEEGVRGGNYM